MSGKNQKKQSGSVVRARLDHVVLSGMLLAAASSRCPAQEPAAPTGPEELEQIMESPAPVPQAPPDEVRSPSSSQPPVTVGPSEGPRPRQGKTAPAPRHQPPERPSR